MDVNFMWRWQWRLQGQRRNPLIQWQYGFSSTNETETSRFYLHLELIGGDHMGEYWGYTYRILLATLGQCLTISAL